MATVRIKQSVRRNPDSRVSGRQAPEPGQVHLHLFAQVLRTPLCAEIEYPRLGLRTEICCADGK